MSKAPDPSPPPKASQEERRFKSLLRKLVAGPREEIQEQHKEYKHRKKPRRRP
jgi:hypothetical protein